MANYVKIFDGAGKDAGTNIVVPDEFDPEYNAIATAIGTKANSVSGGTNGNLLETDADGDLVDSGIASANLDGLTAADLQADLDSRPENQTSLGSDFNQAGHIQLFNGFFNKNNNEPLTLLAEDTWYSHGPIGSGATYEYTDDFTDWVQPGARIIGARVSITARVNGQQSAISLFARDGNTGGSVGSVGSNEVARVFYSGQSSSYFHTETFWTLFPCDEDQITYWQYGKSGDGSLISFSFVPWYSLVG